VRIVQVVGAFAPERCGVAHYTARLARALAEAGETVAIASRPTDAASPVPYFTLSAHRWRLTTLAALLRLSRHWGADWLHLQYAPGSYDRCRLVGWLPLLARLVPGGPRVATTLHEYGGWPPSAPRGLQPLAKPAWAVAERAGWLDRESLTLLSASDVVVVTNPDHRDVIHRRSPALAARVRMVPIGPNVGPEDAPSEDRRALRRRLGVADDQVLAVFFGFVHPVKGIETLLQALAEGNPALTRRLRLWIVGGVHSLALRGAEADGYEATLRARMATLGLTETVDFTGFLPDADVAARLRAADLAVLPFNHGATMKSGTLITCLAFGLPVLTTSGGQLPGLTPGENVWLVPPKDPAALTRALSTLAADGALRARLGHAGQAVAGAYQWPDIAARHQELYHGDSDPSRRVPVAERSPAIGGLAIRRP
jgi:glycosyltransferase involved in cell wall biosynthesis